MGLGVKDVLSGETDVPIPHLQCSPWPDTPTTFVNNSPAPAPTFTSAQHNTYSVPDRSVAFLPPHDRERAGGFSE